MRKIFDFLRSVNFGLVVLLVVVGFSVLGSLIPQTFDEPWYLENYPRFGQLVITLGLHRMFSQWYFAAVCALFGLNLALSAAARVLALRNILPQAFAVPTEGYGDELDDVLVTKLRGYLQKKRYRELNTGDATIYHKNRFGHFGSLCVTVSLFMILLFGGLMLALSYTQDVLLLPGETAELSDGSNMHLFSFERERVAERTESVSVVEVITPDGRSSGVREVRVNRPLRFNSYNFYQFWHLYAGSITAVDMLTGGRDTFYLVDRSFLSADDGLTGIWFETVFQGFRIDEDTGRIIPLRYDAPVFPNPLYYFMVIDEHVQEYRFAIPGSHVHVGTIRFEFNDMIYYPGIRISYQPHPLPALLLASALILIAGIYLTFYRIPSTVVLKGNRYALTSIKASGVELDIRATLYDDEGAKAADAPGSGDEKSAREVDI